MKYFIVKTKDLGYLVKVVLGANKDNIEYNLDIEKKELWISEFEAYRTGLRNIRKFLLPRKCYLRACWYHFDDVDIGPTGYSMYSTSTDGCIRSIDTGYKGITTIYGPIGGRLYTAGNYSISFDEFTRMPYLGYHIYPGDKKYYIKLSVRDFMKINYPEFSLKFGLNINIIEYECIQKIMKYLVKY